MNSFECLLPYDELAEGPGVARGKKIEKKILKVFKKFEFFSLYHPPVTHECQKKIRPNRSSRLAGYTQHIFKCLVLLFI